MPENKKHWLLYDGTCRFCLAMVGRHAEALAAFQEAVRLSPTYAELDRFIHAMRALAEAAKAGDKDRFKGAPFHAPMKRLDETRAARQPVLRWTAPDGSNMAAE